jgi:NH3-dependent NAD+ synthetase
MPLAGLWKSEVMALCNFIGVPSEIMQSSRRADPDCGRPPEMAEIPLELIDLFLRANPGSASVRRLLTPAQIAYLTSVRDRNAFKRALPTKAPRVPVLRTAQLAKLAARASA